MEKDKITRVYVADQFPPYQVSELYPKSDIKNKLLGPDAEAVFDRCDVACCYIGGKLNEPIPEVTIIGRNKPGDPTSRYDVERLYAKTNKLRLREPLHVGSWRGSEFENLAKTLEQRLGKTGLTIFVR